MLENVIKSAGYKVGRITSVGGYDSRAVVYLDGEIPPIDEYNRSVAELKGAALKYPDEKIFRQEASFILALLLCKMRGCEFLIFEGLSGGGYSFDAICAPYDLVLVPSIYDSDNVTAPVCCEAIKRGVREVVSGNQKKNVYDDISTACVLGGVRLTFTSKQSFRVESVTSRGLTFTYSDRSGYALKSPSLVQRECAMLVIEAALAIRRDGVKVPWTSICTGLSQAQGTGCFETISVSPIVIMDSSKNADESAMLMLALDEVFGREKLSSFYVCLPREAASALSSFDIKEIEGLISLGDIGYSESCGKELSEIVCDSITECAREIQTLIRDGKNVICLGSCEFASEMKSTLARLMIV
jgi:folylpolyglutamate synthase/dihydropteroate synthase